MRNASAIPAVGLIVGAALGLAATDRWHPAVAGVLLAVSLVLATRAWHRRRPRMLTAAVFAGFVAGGVLLSASAWQRAWRPPLRVAFEDLAQSARTQAQAAGRRLPEDDEAFAVVEGMLRTDAATIESGVSLSIDVDAIARRAEGAPERTHGGILATVVGSLAAPQVDRWRAGRRVRLPVMLHRPSRYLDPGVPDNERALARRGTTLVGTVKSGALVDVLARGNVLDESFAAARAFARRAIASAVGRWNPQSGAIVAAIVIGDRAGLDDRVQRGLQEAGTYHVIAISGGNIAILAGLMLGAFRIAGWLGRTAMLCAIVVLIAYARLVGGGASVDRATLMAVVYFGGRAFDQRSPPLNGLSLVAGLLVMADPLTIADPAFVLTCGATLGILLVVPAVAAHRFPAFLSPAIAMFAASVAAEALLFPVGAIAFSRVTFAGLGLNFLAIPLMVVVQIAGMALVPIAAVSPAIAALVGWVAHLGAAGLITSSELVRFAPALAYRVAPPALLVVGLYYAAAAGWWAFRGAIRRACATAATVAALWILVDPRTIAAARGDGRLHVTFIDVGQGDSALVVFPHGSTMVVDTGGLSSSSSFDIGDRVVAPVIRRAGIRRLDVLALTHGDPDHIGGAASLLTEFRPHQVWEGIPVPRLETMNALREQAATAGSVWSAVRAGDRRTMDDVDVSILHPGPADWERQKVRNDDSIVIELRWRDVSILLTGDIGKVPEHSIAPTIATSLIRVLKIPHHGSLTSSSVDFVQAIHPSIAVVSAGRNNHFGHPVPEILERYRAAGAEIFRTDRDGAVMVDTDGHQVSVRTFTQRLLDLPRKHETTK